MRRLLSQVNVPTIVAVMLIIMADRRFDVSGMALRAIGQPTTR